jgi:hypothetical protein
MAESLYRRGMGYEHLATNRKLTAAGKPGPKVVVAIARDPAPAAASTIATEIVF